MNLLDRTRRPSVKGRCNNISKADQRWATEVICTVNLNDSRYNAEKWAKRYRLTQANYVTELGKRH